VDDTPLDHDHEANDRPTIDIPEDIAEENEDDENFATSAVSETMEFAGLSPPPPRALSPAMSIVSIRDAGAPGYSESYLTIPAAPTRPPPRLPTLDTARTTGLQAQPAFPLSALHPHHVVPESPDSTSLPGFELSDNDEEDDDTSGNDEDPLDGNTNINTHSATGTQASPFARHLTATLSTYSLPRTAGTEGEKLGAAAAAGQQSVEEGIEPLMLSSPIPDAGLGELVSELGWMADVIRGEYV
jgi:hypothetical protein